MKLGILHGNFDPVHIGHLILADQIMQEQALDKVLFVPAVNERLAESFEDRYKLIQCAIQGNEKLEVTSIEKGLDSPCLYTDMQYIKKLYAEDEVFVIVGQDRFMAIEDEEKGNLLLKENSFLIGHRPGESTKELFGYFKDLFMRFGKLQMEFFEIPGSEISSTVIRNKLRVGKSVRYYLPDSCLDYIQSQNLYEILIPKLKAFVKGNVKEHRYIHTEGVVDTARKLAIRYNVDPKKAEIAAWFHDAYRSAGNLEHGPVAAEHIQSDFHVNDPDIVQAIQNHTTGRPGMTPLDKIIYVADSLEPNRDYPGVDELRKIMYVDLDEVLYKLMVHTRDYVHSIGGTFDPMSDAAIADLEEKRRKNG